MIPQSGFSCKWCDIKCVKVELVYLLGGKGRIPFTNTTHILTHTHTHTHTRSSSYLYVLGSYQRQQLQSFLFPSLLTNDTLLQQHYRYDEMKCFFFSLLFCFAHLNQPNMFVLIFKDSSPKRKYSVIVYSLSCFFKHNLLSSVKHEEVINVQACFFSSYNKSDRDCCQTLKKTTSITWFWKKCKKFTDFFFFFL